MDMRPRIDAMASAWKRTGWADWRGWERYGPTAGSVAAHLIVAGAVASVAASMSSQPRVPPPLETMAVTLVTDVAPPPRVTPPPQAEPPRAPDRPAASADTEVLPEPAPRPRRRNAPAATAPSAPAAGGDAGDDVEVLPPAQTGVPLGLQSLLEKSPCSQVIERLRGDCDSRWAALAEQGGLDHSPTLDELADMYPGFELEEPNNPFWMPRSPERLTRKPSLTGGKVMQPLGAIPSGIGTAGGPAAQTGRLPPRDVRHTDRAFELPPNWLDRE